MRFFVVALAALALAGPAMAGTTYNDSTGENGAAADIASVVVNNDTSAAPIVTFTVTLANMPTLETNAAILIYLDTDRNASTGTPGGYEYVFVLASDGYSLAKWDGTQFTDTGLTFAVTFANGVMTAAIPASDIGAAGSFDFLLVTLRGPDPNNPVVDQAPDAPPIWTYTMATAPVVTPPATPPATPPTKVTISTTAATFSSRERVPAAARSSCRRRPSTRNSRCTSPASTARRSSRERTPSPSTNGESLQALREERAPPARSSRAQIQRL